MPADITPNVYDVEIWDEDDDYLAMVAGVPGASREHACESPAVAAKLRELRDDYPNATVGLVRRAR